MKALTASKLGYDATTKPNALFSPFVLVDGRRFHHHQVYPLHLDVKLREILDPQEEEEDIYAPFRVENYDIEDKDQDYDEEEDGYFCS